ncbi:hypothetical protein EYF80_021606 [Liparis tanakae]|uniref:Uncharacterized protein n=1 Tax=Liparis tanakae TaxID=230148 RepID=A0A4Z2HT32_9TELE|nr:hypothetical protein EYF80_021606 [Liparis tanakae]
MGNVDLPTDLWECNAVELTELQLQALSRVTTRGIHKQPDLLAPGPDTLLNAETQHSSEHYPAFKASQRFGHQ